MRMHFLQARRWDIYFLKSTNVVSLLKCRSKVDGLRETDLIFKSYPHLLLNWAEVQEALRHTAMRYWFQTVHGWELFLGEHSLRQLDGVRSVLADPPPNHSLTELSLDLTLYNSSTCRGLFRKDLKYDVCFRQASIRSLLDGQGVTDGKAYDYQSTIDRHLGTIEALRDELANLKVEVANWEDDHRVALDRARLLGYVPLNPIVLYYVWLNVVINKIILLLSKIMVIWIFRHYHIAYEMHNMWFIWFNHRRYKSQILCKFRILVRSQW